jgi:hypothetical protein
MVMFIGPWAQTRRGAVKSRFKFVTLNPPKFEARNPKSELENTRHRFVEDHPFVIRHSSLGDGFGLLVFRVSAG